MKKLINNEEGFSLLEVTLAVAIMAILTAMAVPTFTGMIPKVQEKADAQSQKNCLIDNKIEELSAVANGTTAQQQDCTNATAAPNP